MFGIEKLIVPLLGNFGTNTVSPLIWGFNFLIGTVMAAVSKAVINGLKKKKVMLNHFTFTLRRSNLKKLINLS